jgi:hypothetical protein
MEKLLSLPSKQTSSCCMRAACKQIILRVSGLALVLGDSDRALSRFGKSHQWVSSMRGVCTQALGTMIAVTLLPAI